jgi:hypothetical protein
MQPPKAFGELIRRLMPADARALSPIVATAWETAGGPGARQPRFWVVIHSVTDRGMKLLHARPLRPTCLSLRIEVAGGEVLRVHGVMFSPGGFQIL